MKFTVHGKNVEVTDALREYIEKKFGKMGKYSRHIHEFNVELSIAKNPRIKKNQAVHVTTSLDGSLLRAEDASENMYATIDLVADKMDRQLKKYEDKRNNHAGIKKTSLAATPEEGTEDEYEITVKRKMRNRLLAVKPMSPEEAVAQMEVLHYKFFLFRNQDTNQLNIVYKESEKDTYGLIIPDESAEEAIVLKVR